MKWSDVGRQNCSVARTLSVVGDRWTMLVIREAFLGSRRFEEFLENIGASRNIVADRLRKLVRHEVLARRLYEDKPPRYEYRLTPRGLDLYPVVAALLGWGDRWMSGEEGPPLQLIHRGCGEPMVPRLACPCCGEAVSARDVKAVPTPARYEPSGRGT